MNAQSYEKTYTYNTSENDLKSSASKAALLAVKTELIQEVGVSIISSFEQIKKIKHSQYNKMIKSNLQTFSIALTKTKILNEKWNGVSYWLKVDVTIDEKSVYKNYENNIRT